MRCVYLNTHVLCVVGLCMVYLRCVYIYDVYEAHVHRYSDDRVRVKDSSRRACISILCLRCVYMYDGALVPLH